MNCHFPFKAKSNLEKTWNKCTDDESENGGYAPWCPYNVKQESKGKNASGNCPGGEEVFEVVQGGKNYWGYCKQSKECSGKSSNTLYFTKCAYCILNLLGSIPNVFILRNYVYVIDPIISFIGACRCRKDDDYVNPCSADWNAGMTCQVEFPTDCSDIMCDFRCEDPRARRYSKTACRLTYLGKNAP